VLADHREAGGGEVGVGNHHRVAVTRDDRGLAPADVGDAPLDLVETDPVAGPHRAVHLERHAAHHRPQRVLQREADGRGRDGAGREHAGNVTVEVPERDDGRGDVCRREHEIEQDSRRTQTERRQHVLEEHEPEDGDE
jgi:hypothetical protein